MLRNSAELPSVKRGNAGTAYSEAAWQLKSFPNPAEEVATITYQLPVGAYVEVWVYDLQGREIATLVQGIQPAGTHSVDFPVSALERGMYLLRMRSGQTLLTEKILVGR
jgi:hypothetical protein